MVKRQNFHPRLGGDGGELLGRAGDRVLRWTEEAALGNVEPGEPCSSVLQSGPRFFLELDRAPVVRSRRAYVVSKRVVPLLGILPEDETRRLIQAASPEASSKPRIESPAPIGREVGSYR